MPSRDDRHRVYMTSLHSRVWHCQFLEVHLKTPLPRKLCPTFADKVIEMIKRRGGLSDLASRQALDLAIDTGRGGVFSRLAEARYSQLMRSLKRPRPLDLMPQCPQ
jgi:hypothetical protein